MVVDIQYILVVCMSLIRMNEQLQRAVSVPCVMGYTYMRNVRKMTSPFKRCLRKHRGNDPSEETAYREFKVFREQKRLRYSLIKSSHSLKSTFINLVMFIIPTLTVVNKI